MHINSTKGPLSSSVGRPGRVAHEIIKLQPSHVWLVEGGEREDIEWGVDDTLEDIVVAIHVALLALITRTGSERDWTDAVASLEGARKYRDQRAME